MAGLASGAQRTRLYRTIWRWHFYAGLFVMPMVFVLALTGSVYLFKPQVDRWEERAFLDLPPGPAVSADRQVEAALAAYPRARFQSYRLPESPGDAALIHLALPDGKGMRDVFVSPGGEVAGALDPARRIIQLVRDVHGQLLLGKRGSWLVELAASWAIVMIVTGLYLWWPRGGGPAGVVWPRFRSGSRVFWRDIHAVTGFWVAGLALVLLTTGLPWAYAWGSAFKAVRAEMGWVKGRQEWTIGGAAPASPDHAGHDHAAMMTGIGDGAGAKQPAALPLQRFVDAAKARNLAFPVLVSPPGASGAFGARAAPVWTVRSDAQNRLLAETLTYDPATGALLSRQTFADKHPIDKVIGYGISWHEGALLGPVNQVIGVLTALMLVTLSASGFVLWWRRRPPGTLGAPPTPAVPARMGGVVVIALGLAAVLPMLALSMAALLLAERLVLSRIPATARWLGLPDT